MSSYPTIKFFPKGTTEPVEYDGARTEDAFVEFLNAHCGTHRTVGGLLDDAVGRVAALDALAARFYDAGAAARQAILAEAGELAAGLGAGAKHYLRVMEKVVNGSEEYLEKESARCVSRRSGGLRAVLTRAFAVCVDRLSSILTKRTLSPGKLDEIKIKANILGAFKPAEPVAEEPAAHDAGEL